MEGDVQCIYYNPAGVATVVNRAASFTYMKHLLDFNFGFVGFVQPHLGPGNLGVGFSFMDYGDFKRTDGSGAVLGNFSANSLSLTATYSLQPVENFSIGLSAKYIRAGIETYTADAVAGDAGVLYSFPQWMLTLAAGVFNLGQPISAFITHKADLPMSIRFGLAKKLEHLPLHLSLTFYRYQNEKWHGALGGEFTLSPQAFLRLGYDNIGRELEVGGNKDRFAGASIGLGLVWRSVHIDYALSSVGELGTLNRFSLSSPF
ncbi:PorV/PorQ family protein, partial [bacterium]|nr:PorV/PorQ family protein [bacterium]